MNNSEIINNIDSFSSSVILVLNNNSNPDAIVKSLIEKLATISLHNLQNYLDLIILDGYKKNIKKDDGTSFGTHDGSESDGLWRQQGCPCRYLVS